MIVPWRIYYGDGTTYDGPPEGAPGYDVQVIVQRHPDVGRELLTQMDYWWYTGETWLGGDFTGMLDYVMHHTGWQKIVCGRRLASPTYDAIVRRALHDPDLPGKSAKLPTERF